MDGKLTFVIFKMPTFCCKKINLKVYVPIHQKSYAFNKVKNPRINDHIFEAPDQF